MIQKIQNPKKDNQDIPKQFLEHLLEIRLRLLIYILTLVITSIISFYFYPLILRFMLLPLNQKLFFTSPAGGLDLMIKLSLLSGFIFSLPMFLYQLLRFIEPSLSKNISLKIITIIVSSFALTILGLSFAYLIGLPAALYFLSSFGSDQIQSLITTNEYFTFVSRYLLGFALFFQLPLIIFFINEFYKISVSTLLKFQKIVIVLSLIVAAILTPTPDFLNQIIMASPLIVLYYFSIAVIHFSNRHIDSKSLT